jgi:LCP family protein required for cell wall assembly
MRRVWQLVSALLLGSGGGVTAGALLVQCKHETHHTPPGPALQFSDPSAETPPLWTGKAQVTVLLVGLDARAGDSDPPRTDTIILASLDTVEKRAVIVSIPRDLWVSIPGHGYDRINAAWPLGEAQHRMSAQTRTASSPLTGAALLRQTIEANFGIPIDYFVAIDFQGFIRVIDALGGVLVDVERPLKDNEYPSFDYPHYERIYIPAGLQIMDGMTALRYVRSRHQDSDFGRQRRQQQVLLAVRERLLRLNMVPRLPQLISTLRDTVRTDMPLTEIVALAHIALEVTPERITTRVIDETLTTRWIAPGGADVQIPEWPEIRRMLEEVWGVSPPVAAVPSPTPLAKQAPHARTGTATEPATGARSQTGTVPP